MTTCSASSLASGEQLFATATRADFWLLLEHPGPYGAKAVEDSSLPAEVRQRLASAAASVPNGRVQLITTGRAPEPGRLAFFVAVNHEEQPNLYEFRLDRAEDLLDLDLGAILREDLAFRSHDRTDPLFLVCTNGKRDACCARLGLPLFRALDAQFGEAVWQTSHVGGHRFAPNLVALPAGVFYGTLTVDSAVQAVRAMRSGEIFLPAFRGRSCYAEHVQAAEMFLRQETGRPDLLPFKLVETRELPETPAWMFEFRDRAGNEAYCVHVRQEAGAVQVLKSCGESAPSALHQFRLVDLRSLPGIPG